MKRYASHVWQSVRGNVLALLGVAAAYGLSLALDAFGVGFWWQAGLGFPAFLATVVGIGRYSFGMTVWHTVEESADAIHCFAITFGRVALIVVVFLTALVGANPRYI